MTIIVFDPAIFRAQFPAFADSAVYTDIILDSYWEMATCFVNNNTACTRWGDKCLRLALDLMTAHLVYLNDLLQSGQTPQIVTSATIDKVTVSLQAPPNPDEWNWWLSTTPYGLQLLALLKAKSIGGFYAGGLPETAAFRRIAGIFY